MTTLYKAIQQAEKGDVIWTERPARNVTSSADRVGRKVRTESFVVIGARTKEQLRLVRVVVIS